ncbi:MAG: conjugal transfer protein TraG N-terminal domain-containing protein, partial [Litorimonas sp.]
MATETYEVPIMTDGAHLQHMFEAVALMTGADGLMGSVENMIAVIGVLVLLLMVTLKGNWSAVLQWLFVYALVWGVLVVPKVTVNVLDRSDPASVGTEPVSGVPLGLGVPVSIATRFGDRIAALMETALSVPSDFSYSSGRLMWGPELFEQSLAFDVQGSVARENMERYLAACVLPRTVSVPDYRARVRTTGDILTVLGADAPANRLVQIRSTAGGPLVSTVCRDAVAGVSAAFTTAVNTDMADFAQRLYPALGPAEAQTELLGDLSRGTEQFIGVSKAGAEYLRQVAIIRALRNAASSYANDPGATALISYVEGKSEAQATLTMSALGSLMQDSLPRIYTITLILLIAIFPIVIFMALLPGAGLPTLKTYFGSLIYIQAFGILFVVINSVIVNDQVLAGQALALTGGGTERTLNLANYGLMRDMPSQISATASMLLLSIPALSAIFTRGAMGIGQSIQSSLRPLEKSAEVAASEASSGNISVGNASTNMISQNQATGYKLDTNTVGRTGMTTLQADNGAVHRRMRDGSSVTDTSQARGNFATSGAVQASTSEEIGRRINSARSRQRTAAQALSEARTESSEQAASMFMSLVRGNSTMSELGINETSEEGRALSRALNQVQSYNESNDTRFSDAIQGSAYAKGSAEASAGLQFLGSG